MNIHFLTSQLLPILMNFFLILIFFRLNISANSAYLNENYVLVLAGDLPPIENTKLSKLFCK